MATRQYTQLIIVYAFPTIFAVGLFIFTGYNETTIWSNSALPLPISLYLASSSRLSLVYAVKERPYTELLLRVASLGC